MLCRCWIDRPPAVDQFHVRFESDLHVLVRDDRRSILDARLLRCDQSQVQRYLTARSLKDARQSLLISAFAKVPLQALILLTGVLVFVFYVFHEPPGSSIPPTKLASGRAVMPPNTRGWSRSFIARSMPRRVAADAVVTAHESGSEAQLRLVESGFNARNDDIRAVRDRAEALVKQVAGDERSHDVNYVFPTFVIGELPIGLSG